MARYVRSLIFNLEDGVDVKRHREHRSKKGRNKYDRARTPSFFKYKNKKWMAKYENE